MSRIGVKSVVHDTELEMNQQTRRTPAARSECRPVPWSPWVSVNKFSDVRQPVLGQLKTVIVLKRKVSA